MKINLVKALKLKNKYVGKMNLLKTQALSNCYQEGQKVRDITNVWTDYEKLVNSLINLKVEIAKANVGINEKILRLSEYKTQIQQLNMVPTNEGPSTKYLRDGTEQTIITKCFHSMEAIDALKNSLESQIETLQDDIDVYNATTFIEVNV
jgi:hypothetical protein